MRLRADAKASASVEDAGHFRNFCASDAQSLTFKVGLHELFQTSGTESLRLCTQLSRLRTCGVCCVAWRRASTVVNLWLYLVGTICAANAQNLTSRLRVNEVADIMHHGFVAVSEAYVERIATFGDT